METIVDVLAGHADRRPDALFARFVDGDDDITELSYAVAWESARRWAAYLQGAGLGPDRPVILSLTNHPDFVGAYFGTLLCGAVPVPVAPATRPDPSDPRQVMIAERLAFLGAGHVILSRGTDDVKDACLAAAPGGTVVLTSDDLPVDAPDADRFPPTDPDALGLIQFSSGTAGAAKAVELTHRALLAQVDVLNAAIEVDPASDTALSWLPFFHDMGLIGFLLAPAYAGASVTILPTEVFLRNPRSWPRAVTRFGASVIGGPPSAFGMVARFVREAERGELDLSSVRLALIAAETIEPPVLRAFADRFEPSGLRFEALTPGYGLAENALCVTLAPAGAPFSVDVVDPEILQREGRAAPADGAGRREITSVGRPVPRTEVAIADASGRHLDERRVGEILVRSGSLMRGYRGEAESAVRDGWLWTGDLGYLADGELYITGRSKELIIVGGANYVPDDLERVAGAVEGVRHGRAVAFSVADPERSAEQVVVLVETTLKDPVKQAALSQEVRRALVAADLPVTIVGLAPPRFIRSTDTGKVKRVDARQRYLAGELHAAS